MKQGTLFYDRECGRYNFHYKDEEGDKRGYGGIHCGEVFEFKLNDVWVPPPPPNAPKEKRLMPTEMMKLKRSPSTPPRRPMLPASIRNIARISRT